LTFRSSDSSGEETKYFPIGMGQGRIKKHLTTKKTPIIQATFIMEKYIKKLTEHPHYGFTYSN